MDTKNPLAFPHMAADGHSDYRTGMSLRDYFAGQALAVSLRDYLPETAVEKAYEVADAMLAFRAKGK